MSFSACSFVYLEICEEQSEPNDLYARINAEVENNKFRIHVPTVPNLAQQCVWPEALNLLSHT